MIGFALCHGWSFNAHAMDAFAENLSSHFPACPIVRFDLGFTGNAHVPSLDAFSNGEVQWIAIGHSYGFAYLMQQACAWRAAISVNGFLRFCRRPGKTEGTPARLVDAMIARLDSDPLAAVTEFQLRCGGRENAPESLNAPCDVTLNVPLLSAHLKRLRDLDLPAPEIPILSLSTHDDLIVPPSLTHACFAHAGGTMEEYEGAHLHLLRDPLRCMMAISSFVEANRG